MTMTEAPKTYSFKKLLLILWIIVVAVFIVTGGDGSGGILYKIYGVTACLTWQLSMMLPDTLSSGCTFVCQTVSVFIVGAVLWAMGIGGLQDWLFTMPSSDDSEKVKDTDG